MIFIMILDVFAAVFDGRLVFLQMIWIRGVVPVINLECSVLIILLLQQIPVVARTL